jgi:microcystin-dependent protein
LSTKIECGSLKSTGASDFTGVTTVPIPTSSNSNEVVNTQYLTSVLSNYSPVNNGSPTGTIITFAVMATNLQGYLLCDGSSYDPTIYPNLYAVIGTQFGGTIYNPQLPDYRGSFLRGYNNGSVTNNRGGAGNSAYLSGAIGAMQTGQVGSHTHGFPHRNQVYGGAQSVYHYTAVGNSDHIVHGTSQFDDTVEYNIPSGENRPVNFSVYYYIKT